MFYNLLVSSSKRIRFFFSLLERKIPRRSSGSIGKLSQRIYIYKVVHSPCNPEAGNPLMQPRLSAAVCHDDVCHPFLPPPHESTVRRSSTGSDFRARLITAGIIWLRAPVWKIQFLQLSFRTFWCRRETRSACLLAGWLWGWSGGFFGRWNGRGEDRQIGGWWRRLKKAGRRSAPRGNWSEEGKGRGGGKEKGERIEPLVEIRH